MQGKGLKASARGRVSRAPARRKAGARAEGLTCSRGKEDREGRGAGIREKKAQRMRGLDQRADLSKIERLQC